MKKHLVITVLIMLFVLTGCRATTPTSVLSDNKNKNLISEYIAGTILKYDKNYSEALVYENKKPAPTQEPKVDKVVNQESTDTSKNSGNLVNTNHTEKVLDEHVKLADIFKDKKYEITYNGYSLYEDYPNEGSDSYFTLEAGEGNQLMVVSFNLQNKSNKKIRVDLSQSGIKYQLNIGNDMTYKSSLTLLLNDLNYLNTPIKAKKSMEVVLVFEIPRNQKMDNLQLFVTKGEKSAAVELERK